MYQAVCTCLGISGMVRVWLISPPVARASKLAPQSCVDVSYLGKVWRHIVVWSVTASAFGHNIGCHSCWVSIAGCACYIRVICTAWLLKAFAVRMSRHFVNSESMVYLAARCKGFEISTTNWRSGVDMHYLHQIWRHVIMWGITT